MQTPRLTRLRLLRLTSLALAAAVGLGLLLIRPTPSQAASIAPWQNTVWAWVQLSRPVANVAQDGLVVRERDSGRVIPALTLCKNGGTDVPCTSGQITRVGLFPDLPFRLGEYYTVTAAPRLLDGDGKPPLSGSTTFRAGPREEDQGGTTSFAWATRGHAAAFDKSYTVENRARATATMTFTGSFVYVWTALATTHGQFDIYIDNVWRRSFDAYGKATRFAVPVGVTGLAPGRHRLDVVVKGTKQPASMGTNVVLDAVNWQGGVSLTPPFTYSWGPSALSTWSNGFGAASEVPGSTASITFRGPAIDVATMRGPGSGIVRVTMDGRPVGDFDDYAPAAGPLVRRFQANGDAVHTIAITPTGGHNRASMRAAVGVDYWEVPDSPSAPTAPSQRVAPPSDELTWDRRDNLPATIPPPPADTVTNGSSR